MVPTLLAISGLGLPPFSLRGATQSLEPIPQAMQLRRTVNGALIDLSAPGLRKYAATIAASDQQPPALDGVWPGHAVVLSTLVELALPGTIEEPSESETESPFARPPVPGSVRHESGFTFYRAELAMRVVAFQVTRDPWGAAVDWTLTLEEA